MKKIYSIQENNQYVSFGNQNFSGDELTKIAQRAVYGILKGNAKLHLSVDDIEDVCQDVLYKMLKARSAFDPNRASVRTWVSKIAYNCIVDTVEKRVRGPKTISLTPIMDGYNDEDCRTNLVDLLARADADFECVTDIELVNQAKASLSKKHRLVLELRDAGYKPSAIADELGITPNAASILLNRARKALMEKLGYRFLNDYCVVA